MSEHTWVLEHLETYVTGGLDDVETGRLERHIVDCPPCTDALSGVQGVDRALSTLFAPVLPAADVEDRVIQSLRLQHRPGLPRFVKWGMAAAAVILVGVTGAGMSAFAMKDGLRFPGMDAVLAMDDARSMDPKVAVGLYESVDFDGDPKGNDLGYFPPARALVVKGGKGISTRINSSVISGKNESLVDVPKDNMRGENPGVPPSADELAANLRQRTDWYVHDGEARLAKESKTAWADADRVASLDDLSQAKSDQLNESAPGQKQMLGFGSGVYKNANGTTTWGRGGGGGGGFGNGGMGMGPGGGAGAPAGGPVSGGGSAPAIPGAQYGFSVQGATASAGQPGGAVNINGVTDQKVLAALVDGTANTQLYSDVNKQLEVDKKLSKEVGDQLYLYYRNDWKKAQDTPPLGTVAVSPDGKSAPTFAPPSNEAAFKMRVAAPTTAPAPTASDSVAVTARVIAATEVAGGPQQPVPAGAKPEPGKPASTPSAPPAQAAQRKIIIRSGTIEFEIESFDSAVATVTKLTLGYQGGYVATVNSEKLANGKVRGTVVIRVPPEHLDGLVLDLRKELGKGGELKGQKIGSEDITKMYTDMESRLKAAQAMQERLLDMIAKGKGEIKDLLNAEKELGIWRTKIEELQGEIKYYGNLASLSTLTITLAEKEIRAPSAVTETERIQMGIEAEDVDKTQRDALAAITDAKGRVTKSELKQQSAGQFNAIIHFEVAPDAAGPLRDRLKQLGNVARLEIDRATQTEGGTGKPQDAKLKRADTQFQVSIYNLTSVLPRETVVLHLACIDTEAAYKAILARAQKATARILNSNLNQLRPEQTTGTVAFEVKAAEADTVLKDIKDQGEVLRQQVAENPDQQATTKSKRGFVVTLLAHSLVQPREVQTMTLVTRDVPAGYRALQEAVAKAKGLVRKAQLNEQDKQKISADLEIDFQRAEEATITAALTAAGEIHNRNVQRAQEADNVSDSKIRVTIRMLNVANIPPRESTMVALEVKDVDAVAAAFSALVGESKGRTLSASQAYERNGRITKVLEYDVPLVAASGLVDKLKAQGTIRLFEGRRNDQVPDGELARAYLNVTLSNDVPLVPTDDGFGRQFRGGLSYSLKALALSGSWLIFGLCVLLPWALVTWGLAYVGIRIYRRMSGTVPATTT